MLDASWAGLDAAQRELTPALADLDVSEAELAEALWGAATYAYLQLVCADPAHPSFVPGPGYHLHTGTPNPDTVYLNAAIDGTGTYRISGRRGTVPDLTIMPMGPPTATGMRTHPALDLADLPADEDGGIDVLLSAVRPDGHEGAWWALAPEATTLMVRGVSDDWGRHREPALAITRLDVPAPRRRRDEADLAGRMAMAVAVATGAIRYGLRKVPALRAEGAVNAVTLVDYAANGGLAGQWYHEGVYDLRGGDVLVLEADLGAAPAYFSLALTDGLFCTLDWANAQTSLNRTQAAVDDDGVLRAVVAPDDPGVANWLDTMGHRVGVLQLRWAGVPEPPAVSVRALRPEDVAAALPRSRVLGADERAATLGERARRAQLRALW